MSHLFLSILGWFALLIVHLNGLVMTFKPLWLRYLPSWLRWTGPMHGNPGQDFYRYPIPLWQFRMKGMIYLLCCAVFWFSVLKR